MRNVTIDVKHVTRVEGHGNIRVRVRDAEITSLQLAIVESPRFFESFLRGRRWDEAPHITCRICGICSVGHTTASVKAVEAACGIDVTDQTVLLRKLMLFGEHIQSHVLHLYFLAVPDFFGVGSVIPLAKSHPEVVKRALRMKKLANDVCGVVGGRHIHPIAMHVGGFSHVPPPEALIDLKRRLETARADVAETVSLFSTLQVPALHRETEYMALSDLPDKASKHEDTGARREYALYDGRIVSTMDDESNGAGIDPQDYRQRVIESVVEHSSAKHCRSPNAPSYAVGALARFNNNHVQLHPAAQRAAADLGLAAPCNNPFHNNTAQLVETVHCMESAIALIDLILARGLHAEPPVQPTKFGRGVGAAEVPRGLLFHEYTIGDDGHITDVNLIIPTGQNLANIEADLRALVPKLLDAGLGKEEMTLKLEMLVRAYDPCISCATHFLDVSWE